MNFGEAISEGFFNYANFGGRASRAEYWWWTPFAAATILIAAGIDLVAFPGWGVSPFALIVSLAVVLPSLSVTVRRLHDSSRSGWWGLLAIFLKSLLIAGAFAALLEVPLKPLVDMDPVHLGVLLALFVATAIVLIAFLLAPGDTANNRYGPNRYAGS